jgi:ribonuclease D
VSYDLIINDQQLRQFCEQVAGAPEIAFDTEFVSEDTFRPQLCLVQVAAAGRLAVIDPLAVRDVTPFWRLVTSPGHETIVHAGREELLFCLNAVGQRPTRLFDVQIAAGLVGFEYPAGYGSLLFKLTGEKPNKGETRTDWRRRPLSDQQIVYALDDVRHLKAMRDRLAAKLERLGRMAWLESEMADWQDEIDAGRSRERWWRVSGISGLSSRSLAIVREVCRWRDTEAERRDWPARRILRDDLIIELAKRRSADMKQIRSLRGMERGDLQRSLPKLSEAIGRALAIPDEECPHTPQRDTPSQLNLLGQFLSSALSSICRSASVAPSIVGTASDVRELIAYHMRLPGYCDQAPVLGRGWRADVVGALIEDLLSGKVAIRISDPLADEPLSFERLPPTAEESA